MILSQITNHIIGIYKINFPNGKVYIGLSNDIKRRIQEHYRDSRKDLPVYRALIKYYANIQDIEFEILETIQELDYNVLSDLERKWIAYYHSNEKEYGYNLTIGGLDLIVENNPYSKFTIDDLKDIKKLLKENHSNVYIADLYNVHPDTIGKINNGVRYYDPKESYPLRKETAIERIGFESNNSITQETFNLIVDLLKNSTLSREEIKQQTGVDLTTISSINNGKKSYCPKNWKYPLRINQQNKTKLKIEDILNIHKLLLDQNLTMKDIAEKYNCSRDTIVDINIGKRHRIEGVLYPIRAFYPKRKSSKKPVSTISESGE